MLRSLVSKYKNKTCYQGNYNGNSNLYSNSNSNSASVIAESSKALESYLKPLTQAMVSIYNQNQQRFTTAVAPQYVYSPRELTRWVKGISESFQHLIEINGNDSNNTDSNSDSVYSAVNCFTYSSR